MALVVRSANAPVATIHWENDPIKAIVRAGVDSCLDVTADCTATVIVTAYPQRTRAATVASAMAYSTCLRASCEPVKGSLHTCTDASVDSTRSFASKFWGFITRN